MFEGHFWSRPRKPLQAVPRALLKYNMKCRLHIHVYHGLPISWKGWGGIVDKVFTRVRFPIWVQCLMPILGVPRCDIGGN